MYINYYFYAVRKRIVPLKVLLLIRIATRKVATTPTSRYISP